MHRRSPIPLTFLALFLTLLVNLSVPFTNAQQIPFRASGDAAPAPAAELSSAEPAAIIPGIAPRPIRPVRPRSPALAPYDWSLLSANGVLRFLDYRTTEKCLSDPANFQEKELPGALVRNKPAFATFETGTVLADYFAYRLVARRHRPVARLGQYIVIGSIGWAVGGNYTALCEYFPRRNTPRLHSAHEVAHSVFR